MGILRRFPKTHTAIVGLIALPLIALLVSQTRVEPADAAAPTGSADAPSTRVGISTSVDATEIPVATPAHQVATNPDVAPSELIERVRAGDSLARIFKRVSLPPGDLAAVLESGSLSAALKRIYPDNELRFITSSDGRLMKLSYAVDRLHTLEFARQDTHFVARRITRKADVATAYKHGTIDQSLFATSQRIGLSDAVTLRLAQIFQWDVDFVLDIRNGDEFSMLFEETYVNDEFVGYGKILAAEFINRATRYRAVYYVDASGRGDYYSASGESMRKAFLRAPVEFSRISSNFNLRRFHPIQKRVMPHRGIDYVAPTGTPILAAGDGRVVSATRTVPNGNYIVVQHGNSIQTKYLHLSKFGRGIRSGSRVSQGQVIGYVGATGWATAPHLHYEFLVNGTHRNPRTVALPKAQPVPASELARFRTQSVALLAQLDSHRNDVQLARNP